MATETGTDATEKPVETKPVEKNALTMTAAEKKRMRLKRERAAFLAAELPPGLEERLKEDGRKERRRRAVNKARQHKRTITDEELKEAEKESFEPLMKGVEPLVDANGAGEDVSSAVEPATPDEVEEPNPNAAMIAEIASKTPEVRFRASICQRPFNDDELKIIAAALRTRTPLYRTADILQCTYTKLKNAIDNIPVLKELAQERVFREQEETEEAIDACIRARVPAVVMWKAEKIMPEKYGNQVNIDNEDDTKLVIGALSEEVIAEAEAKVAEAEKADPVNEVNAVLEVMEQERAAEMAAAGYGVPTAPLASIPPAPALAPSGPRFGQFASAADMGRVDFDARFTTGGGNVPANGNVMPDGMVGDGGFGGFGSFDDFDDDLP